jgi:lipoprotein-anchoring transpeptidase ErfK/SrfK
MKQLVIFSIFIWVVFGSSAVAGQVIPAHGKIIVVSLTDQALYAIQDGTLVAQSGAVTGKPDPQHYTPTGAFAVLKKENFHRFVSPHKKGTPLWYPTSNSYGALLFRASGGNNLYIHDADEWRGCYGLACKRNYLVDGSHGCVNVSGSFARWLLGWADIGTPVKITSKSIKALIAPAKNPQAQEKDPVSPTEIGDEIPKP